MSSSTKPVLPSWLESDVLRKPEELMDVSLYFKIKYKNITMVAI